ncbi:MAG TPA: HEAT repeat domain-containing protein, partial [Abditibacterium sp.]
MHFRFFARLVILAVLLCSTSAASAWSRVYSPMSDYVRRATLIAIVDAGPIETRGQITLTLREILKGESKEGFSLPQSPRMGPSVPPNSRGWVALFEPSPTHTLQLLEAYEKPEQIEALRQVLKIAEIRVERGRLEAWRALLPNPNPLYGENFLWELREMRDSNNFPLLLDSLSELNEADQPKLVQLVGEIGDSRGLPKLLEWMNQAAPTPAEQKIARHAAHQLTFYFPGAAGVTQAFRAASETEHLKGDASYYLRQRDSKLQLAMQNQTPYSRAQAHAESGNLLEARRLWLEVLEDVATNDWTRLDVAERLNKSRQGVTPGNLERQRRAMLPLVMRLSHSGNYSETESAVKIAGDWHHSDAIAPLLLVLGRKTESILEKAQRSAFFDLCELGPQARKQAETVLKTRLQSEKTSNSNGFDSILIPLCWLSHAPSDPQIAKMLDQNARHQWEKLAPLRAAAHSNDETAALIALLQRRDSVPYNTLSWILARLGEKRDPRALPAIANFLAEHPYQLPQESAAAIVRIGGSQAEQEVVKLLRDSNDETRRRAVDLLVTLQGARALPLLREMAKGAHFGSRSQAIFQITYMGTPNDLAWLLPL